MKPIFIIRFPANINNENFDTAKRSVSKSTEVNKDYHILVMRDVKRQGEVLYECYNSPHTDMEFEDLKKYVESLIH